MWRWKSSVWRMDSSRHFGERLPSLWHFFWCHSLRRNGEMTQWTDCLSGLIVLIGSACSRGDKIGLILSCCWWLGRILFSRDAAWNWIEFPIPNRLGNDGTSSGRSNGGSSLPPCTSSPGTSRPPARDCTYFSDLYGDATLCMYIHVVTTLGDRVTATREDMYRSKFGDLSSGVCLQLRWPSSSSEELSEGPRKWSS
jgi:hypothetical protein